MSGRKGSGGRVGAGVTAWLERIDNSLGEVREAQAGHSALLAEHMRRTEALEEALELQRKDIEPLRAHVAVWGAVGKIVSALGVLGGGAAALARLLGWV